MRELVVLRVRLRLVGLVGLGQPEDVPARGRERERAATTGEVLARGPGLPLGLEGGEARQPRRARRISVFRGVSGRVGGT